MTNAYDALFVCMDTKSSQLELVHNLSLLVVLTKFVSRLGNTLEVFSDGVTHFFGATRDLQEPHSSNWAFHIYEDSPPSWDG